MYKVDRRLCLDAAGKVVDCESTEARELLAIAGDELTDERARDLGLVDDPKARGQAANKARASAEDK